MSWGPTERWVHRDDWAAVEQPETASKLRELIRTGEVGVVEFCSEERRKQLDRVEDILSERALKLVHEEVA